MSFISREQADKELTDALQSLEEPKKTRFVSLAWVLVVLSLLGNVFLIEHNGIGWLCWIVSNIGWIVFHARKRDYPSTTLFSVYLVLAIWGFISWIK